MSSVSNLTTTDGPNWDTPENHGPVVSVLTWLLIVASFLTVATRLATRYSNVREVRYDDITIAIAVIFAIAQSVMVSLEVVNGLGREESALYSAQLRALQKDAYAADFLYIGTLCFVKLSLCLYLDTLTPKRLHKMISILIGGFTCLWAASAILVHAFQCKLPHAWDFLDNNCIDLAAFWTYFNTLNIVTDIGLIVLPFMILVGLQVDRRKKLVILACFASRTFTIAATILQIYYLNHAFHSPSPTGGLPYSLYLPTILTQIVQALSLITACIPYLKPFLEALETGMIRAGGAGSTRTRGFGSIYTSSSGKRSKSSKSTTQQTGSSSGGESRKGGAVRGGGGGGGVGGKAKLRNVLGSKVSSIIGGGGGGGGGGGREGDEAGGTQRSFGNGGAVQLETLTAAGEREEGEGEMRVRNEIRTGAGSDRDSTGSRAGIIKKTVDWEVRDEEEGGGGGRVGEAV